MYYVLILSVKQQIIIHTNNNSIKQKNIYTKLFKVKCVPGTYLVNTTAYSFHAYVLLIVNQIDMRRCTITQQNYYFLKSFQ